VTGDLFSEVHTDRCGDSAVILARAEASISHRRCTIRDKELPEAFFVSPTKSCASFTGIETGR
jgi:hypothetical protein